MTFRRRTYPEIVDSMLTSVSGGIAAEQHPFPPSEAETMPYLHILNETEIGEIISLYGTRAGKTHQFKLNKDFILRDDQRTLEWLVSGEHPDDATIISVNYRRKNTQPIVTDINTGSVVRTLTEAVSLEIAQLYAFLEVVYKSGFIDTANGNALDNVVALLGVQRVKGAKPIGKIQFSRSVNAKGDIHIPYGTRIMTEDGSIEYETTEAVTFKDLQQTIIIPIRDCEINEVLPADTLTVMPTPLAGISKVTNPAPTVLNTRDETDEELRVRAKNFLHGSERATLGALQTALAHQGISADINEYAQGLGTVEIVPHADTIEPDMMQRLLKTIADVRPAGVKVILKQPIPPAKVSMELLLTSSPGLLTQDLRAMQKQVKDNVSNYFATLTAREPGSINKIVGSLMNVKGIEDVQIKKAFWNNNGMIEDVLDIASGKLLIDGAPTVLDTLTVIDPALPTTLFTTILYKEAAIIPDTAQIESSLSQAIVELNTINETALPDDASAEQIAERTITWQKLVDQLTLPENESIENPYTLSFVVTQENGLSVLLTEAEELDYPLSSYERLVLGNVNVSVEES